MSPGRGGSPTARHPGHYHGCPTSPRRAMYHIDIPVDGTYKKLLRHDGHTLDCENWPLLTVGARTFSDSHSQACHSIDQGDPGERFAWYQETFHDWCHALGRIMWIELDDDSHEAVRYDAEVHGSPPAE